jgi:hypothetical protein
VTIINKINGISIPKLALFPVQGKSAEVGFTANHIRCIDELSLLYEVVRKANFVSSVNNCMLDNMDERNIDHSFMYKAQNWDNYQ